MSPLVCVGPGFSWQLCSMVYLAFLTMPHYSSLMTYELTWSGGCTSFQSTMACPSFHPLYTILKLWLQMLVTQVVVVILDTSAFMLISLPTSSQTQPMTLMSKIFSQSLWHFVSGGPSCMALAYSFALTIPPPFKA